MEVRFNSLAYASEEYSSVRVQLSRYTDQLEQVVKSYRHISCVGSHVAEIRSLEDQLRDSAGTYGQFSQSLINIKRIYEDCEQRVSDNCEENRRLPWTEMGVSMQSMGEIAEQLSSLASGEVPYMALNEENEKTPGTGECDDNQKKLISYLRKVLKKTGNTGTVISSAVEAYSDWSDGKLDGKEFFGEVKDLTKLMDIFVCGSSAFAGFLGGVGVGANVAGKLMGNIEEYDKGEISSGRAVMETMGEVAVDWATKEAVAAAVAVVIPGGIVAEVVGVTAVVAVDWATEAIFGVKATEVISDTIVDITDTMSEIVFGEKASDLLEDVGDTVIAAGKAAGEFVTDVSEKVGKGVTKALGAVNDWIGGWFK